MTAQTESLAAQQALTLYGSNISYFTGKMENYFRIRGIPYHFKSMQFPRMGRQLKQEVGVSQMPAVQLSDGRWLTDTTKMIEWFEAGFSDNALLPPDPDQAFVAHLIEDWADEWWWRPAMHYRWHYPEGARFASWHLATEVMGSVWLPVWLKRRFLAYRQRRGYTVGDGLTSINVPAVEASVRRLFGQLQEIFNVRPYLLGERPSLADIGLAGPFFRHFALDPVPLEILRQTAPAVLEWVARLWNTTQEDLQGDWLATLPDDIAPLLRDIGAGYLPYLGANAEAVRDGRQRFDIQIDGIEYKNARYSRYRVWCLEQLRKRWLDLSEEAQKTTKELLARHGAWDVIWQPEKLPLLAGQEAGLPFRATTKMIGVY
ncbi:MAG: glutathione S-transferase family protein [Luminiphilus sp.]|nr:glutathione S-transferase family protein [Luminiphilus sp.]